jgi:hypothetical protein
MLNLYYYNELIYKIIEICLPLNVIKPALINKESHWIMKKIILFLLVISSNLTAYNQTIRGTVKDQNTGEPVVYAVVYFNGTFIGTYTDQEGNFEIKIPEYISGPLAISSVGYYSDKITYPGPGQQLIVYLKPKVYKLQEVVVSANSDETRRKRMTKLMLFKREFLGNTLTAKRCKVENEPDIKLIWHTDSLILEAFCSKPITINNKYLGYKIEYFLDYFRYYDEDASMVLKGNIIFREDRVDSGRRINAYERRRKQAYNGSRMHFFRELWKNNLNSEGFIVKTKKNNILNYNDLVSTSSDGKKYIKSKYGEEIKIIYTPKSGSSFFSIVKDSVFFDQNGYYNGLGIGIVGAMSSQRIADWLPFEYKK